LKDSFDTIKEQKHEHTLHKPTNKTKHKKTLPKKDPATPDTIFRGISVSEQNYAGKKKKTSISLKTQSALI